MKYLVFKPPYYFKRDIVIRFCLNRGAAIVFNIKLSLRTPISREVAAFTLLMSPGPDYNLAPDEWNEP